MDFASLSLPTECVGADFRWISLCFHFRLNAQEQTFDGMQSASKKRRETELALLLAETLSD
jgi:hypothetical protein